MTLPDGWEARAARDAETDTVLGILCTAFDLDFDAAQPIYYGDPFFDLSHKRVLTAPGYGPVSCLTVVPTTLRVGDVIVPAGGIAGVATRLQFQRRGCASALLEATIAALAEELGYPLSLLLPTSDEFYRRLGWERATHVLRWSASPKTLPRHGEGAFVRRLTVEDWERIFRIQEEAGAGETGAAQRDWRRWRVIQTALPGLGGAVYAEPGSLVTGYLLYELRSEAGSDLIQLHLLEMCGTTPAARRGLLGFLAQQAAICTEIAWATSAATLRLFGLPIPSHSWEPGLMARITDLPAALSCIHAASLAPVLEETGRSLTVFSLDPVRPANEQPVRILPTGIAPGSPDDTEWVRTDIRTLAQIYLGYVTPSDAFVVGLFQCSSADVLILADRLFPLRDPFVPPLDQF